MGPVGSSNGNGRPCRRYFPLTSPNPAVVRMPAADAADDADQRSAALAFADEVRSRVAEFSAAMGDTDRALLWAAFQQCFWPMIDGVGEPDHLQRGLALGWVCGLLEDEHGWTTPGATHAIVHDGICLARGDNSSFGLEAPADFFAVEVGYWCSRTRLRPGSRQPPPTHPVLASRDRQWLLG
jgi:hypothetical protein